MILEFATFVLINLLGAMSPGPDFAIVVRYGLSGSRPTALLAAAGVCSALIIHVLYCLFGLVLILDHHPLVFSFIQSLGAFYLLYLGIRLLWPGQANPGKVHKKRFGQNPFVVGFLTNALNPKASLFLLSLFAGFITPDLPTWIKILYGAAVPVVAFAWFGFLSMMLTHRRFLPHLQKYQVVFLKAMGCILILLASLVLFSVFA